MIRRVAYVLILWVFMGDLLGAEQTFLAYYKLTILIDGCLQFEELIHDYIILIICFKTTNYFFFSFFSAG